MGARSGGGGGAAFGGYGKGNAFASTYGTSGTFTTYGGTGGRAKYVGSTEKVYQVGVYGNKKIGAQTFKSAGAANAFMSQLAKNGFKAMNNGTAPYKQQYGSIQNGKVVWGTTKPKTPRF